MVRLTAGKEETKSGLFHLLTSSQGAQATVACSAAGAAATSGLACLCLFQCMFNGNSQWQRQSELKVFTKGVARYGDDLTDDFMVAFWDSTGPNVRCGPGP